MKTTHNKPIIHSIRALAFVASVAVCSSTLAEEKKEENKSSAGAGSVTVSPGGGGGGVISIGPGGGGVFSATGPIAGGFFGHEKRNVTWLGIAVEQAPESVTAQLPLEKGVGLVVAHVVKDSPAAKAGIEENDLLVKLDEHILVHPAQLRTIVENKKEGGKVTLAFYRKGREQTASVILGVHESMPGPFLPPDMRPWKQFGDVPGLDNPDLKQKLEEARREVERALEKVREAKGGRQESEKLSEQLQRQSGSLNLTIPGNASVSTKIINMNAKEATLMDGTGTYVVSEKDGIRHLKATDKDGKVLYDGEIQTPEQRAKVPAEVMEKAKGLLDGFSGKGFEPERNRGDKDGPAAPRRGPGGPDTI